MTEYRRDFKGVWIPRDVWLDTNLSITEKALIVEIDSLTTDASPCYASNAHFAQFLDLSKSRVTDIISSLANRGYLEVRIVREDGIVKARYITVTPSENRDTPHRFSLVPPHRETDIPPSENGECSNTNSSNTKIKGISPYKPPKGGRISTRQTPGSEVYSQRFEDVWKSWPKGKGGSKADAYKAWLKRKLDDPEHSHVALMILHDVQNRASTHRQWLDGYPPHMSTYLNKSGWTADIDTSTGHARYERPKTAYERSVEASERSRARLRAEYEALDPDEQRQYREAFGYQ